MNRILNPANQSRMGGGGLLTGSATSSYQAQKYQDEIKSLKIIGKQIPAMNTLIVDRLSTKLKEYQLELHRPESEFHLLMSPPNLDSADASLQALESHHLLSTYLLGPLFMEYESMIRIYDRDVKNKSMEIQTQGDEIKLLVRENEELLQRLDIQQREYLKLVEETRDNADLLAIKTGSLKSTGNNFNGGGPGIDEVRDLKERCHLLTDEN